MGSPGATRVLWHQWGPQASLGSFDTSGVPKHHQGPLVSLEPPSVTRVPWHHWAPREPPGSLGIGGVPKCHCGPLAPLGSPSLRGSLGVIGVFKCHQGLLASLGSPSITTRVSLGSLGVTEVPRHHHWGVTRVPWCHWGPQASLVSCAIVGVPKSHRGPLASLRSPGITGVPWHHWGPQVSPGSLGPIEVSRLCQRPWASGGVSWCHRNPLSPPESPSITQGTSQLPLRPQCPPVMPPPRPHRHGSSPQCRAGGTGPVAPGDSRAGAQGRDAGGG